jgi:hypothetical protein
MHSRILPLGSEIGSVVVSKLSYVKRVFENFVNEPMFFGDASRPISGKSMLEGLRLANAFKWVLRGFFDHVIDAPKNLSVRVLPIEIVVPSVFGKDELHSTNSLSTPSPFSSWAIDSINLLVFLGERKR